MYPKLTCSNRVEISIGNKHMFCMRVYFSAHSNSTYKLFHSSAMKRNTKISLGFSKALQSHYMPAFSIQQSGMLVYGSTGNQMFDGMSNFF